MKKKRNSEAEGGLDAAQGEFKFRMNGLRVQYFSLSAPKKPFKFNPLSDNFDFNLQFGGGIDNHDGALIVEITSIVLVKATSEQICEISAQFKFEVLNSTGIETARFLNKNPMLRANILALAYSTLRGVLFERCRGTILEGELLPTVAPRSFLNDLKEHGVSYMGVRKPQKSKSTDA